MFGRSEQKLAAQFFAKSSLGEMAGSYRPGTQASAPGFILWGGYWISA
jgi:hypothetical protein